jgi:hypothetical protein
MLQEFKVMYTPAREREWGNGELRDHPVVAHQSVEALPLPVRAALAGGGGGWRRQQRHLGGSTLSAPVPLRLSVRPRLTHDGGEHGGLAGGFQHRVTHGQAASLVLELCHIPPPGCSAALVRQYDGTRVTVCEQTPSSR